MHQVFVDESYRPGTFLMCSVKIEHALVFETRGLLRALNPTKSHKIHMSEASRLQRKQILQQIRPLSFSAIIYSAKRNSNFQIQRPRERCLGAMLDENMNSHSITIEAGSMDHLDRTLINRWVSQKLSFPLISHVSPTTEPLLWLPDIIAWAYGRGGEWKAEVSQNISKVIQV